MTTASVNVRIDKNLKEHTEKLFKSMGLSTSTAITLFYTAVARQNKIPFAIEADPFYSEENLAHLRRAVTALNAGEGKAHELIEADDIRNITIEIASCRTHYSDK